MRGQLESDLPFVVPLEVPAQQLEAGQAIFLHKGCQDGLSEQAHSKLKLDTGGLEPFKMRVNGLALLAYLGYA